jgi:hypothetical protein
MMWLQIKLSPHFCLQFILLSVLYYAFHLIILYMVMFISFQQVLYYLMLVHHVMLFRKTTGTFNTVSGWSAL